MLGEGNEHQVWQSRHESWVLKTPKLLNYITLRISNRNVAEVLRAEIDFNKRKYAECQIIFPQTRVFSFGNGYVLLQQYIKEDGSMDREEVYIKVSKDPYISSIYDQRSENFVSNNGDLYLVDLTFGFTRIFDKLGILSHEKQNLLKGQVIRTGKKIDGTGVMEFEP